MSVSQFNTLTSSSEIFTGEEELKLSKLDAKLAQQMHHQRGLTLRQITEHFRVSHFAVKHMIETGTPPNARVRRLDKFHHEILGCLNLGMTATQAYAKLGGKERLNVALRTFQDYVKQSQHLINSKPNGADTAIRRVETRPGEQMQIDFGQITVLIAGKKKIVHLFVAVMSHSRAVSVTITDNQRQEAWFLGMTNAFRQFGGVPRSVLSDNARPLVKHVATQHRSVQLTTGYRMFAIQWGFMANVCPPYNPTSKGKVERMVGYVKRGAIGNREFADMDELERTVNAWVELVANKRTLSDMDDEVRTPEARLRDEQPHLRAYEEAVADCDLVCERTLDDKGCLTYNEHRYFVDRKYRRKTVLVHVKGEHLGIEFNSARIKELHVVQDRLKRQIEPIMIDGKPKVGSMETEQLRALYKAHPERFPELKKARKVGKVRPHLSNGTKKSGQTISREKAPKLKAYSKIFGGDDV